MRAIKQQFYLQYGQIFQLYLQPLRNKVQFQKQLKQNKKRRTLQLKAVLQKIDYQFYQRLEYDAIDEQFLWGRLSPLLTYLPPPDITQIYKALTFAYDAHSGDRRKSGEKFISHPVEVARILAELRFDAQTVMAGLLHDTVEDTQVSLEEIGREFGTQVQRIVDGETRLSQVIDDGKSVTKEQRDAQDLARLFLAMTEDVRIILVKLADRLHNMRTMGSMPLHKQQKKSRETIQVYAPIARLIGLYCIKEELEELCFTYLEPEKYQSIKKHLDNVVNSQEDSLNKSVKDVEALLVQDLYLTAQEVQIQVCKKYRTCYSIYKQDPMLQNLKSTNSVGQVQIVLELGNKQWNILEAEDQLCYRILGLMHKTWRPIPGEIKDYIATPKQNGYQALHTKVLYFQKDKKMQQTITPKIKLQQDQDGKIFQLCVESYPEDSSLLQGEFKQRSNGKAKSLHGNCNRSQAREQQGKMVVPIEMHIQTQEMYVQSEYGLASLNWADFKTRQQSPIFQRTLTVAESSDNTFTQITPPLPHQNGLLTFGQAHLTHLQNRLDVTQPISQSQMQINQERRIFLRPQDILRKQQWLKCIQEWQKELLHSLQLTPREFVNMVVDDLFNKGTYVFTRGGDILRLPKGATVVDFAYQVHTEVGNNMLYALVNGQPVKPSYELQNADAVEIICEEQDTSQKVILAHSYWYKNSCALMKSTKYKILQFLKLHGAN